jgi:hypothetical protein
MQKTAVNTKLDHILWTAFVMIASLSSSLMAVSGTAVVYATRQHLSIQSQIVHLHRFGFGKNKKSAIL